MRRAFVRPTTVPRSITATTSGSRPPRVQMETHTAAMILLRVAAVRGRRRSNTLSHTFPGLDQRFWASFQPHFFATTSRAHPMRSPGIFGEKVAEQAGAPRLGPSRAAERRFRRRRRREGAGESKHCLKLQLNHESALEDNLRPEGVNES